MLGYPCRGGATLDISVSCVPGRYQEGDSQQPPRSIMYFEAGSDVAEYISGEGPNWSFLASHGPGYSPVRYQRGSERCRGNSGYNGLAGVGYTIAVAPVI